MNFVTKDRMFSEMERHNMRFYKVFPGINAEGRSGTFLASNYEDESEPTVDQARAELEEVLQQIEGNCTVSLSDTKNKNAGGSFKSAKFNIRTGTSGITGHDGTIGMNERYLSKLDEIQNLRFENFTLKAKISELESGNNAGIMDKFLEKILDKWDGQDLTGRPFKQPEISGAGKMPTAEDANVLNHCVLFLFQQDPEFVENMKLLVDLIQEQPEMYFNAIQGLKQML